MPKGKGTNRLPFPASTGIFTLLVLVLAGIILYTTSVHRITAYQTHHLEIAQAAVSHTASGISLYIQDRRRMVQLFVWSFSEELGKLADDPHNEQLKKHIDSQSKTYFDEAHTFTLTTPTGKILLDDPDNFIGKGCRINISDFAIHRSPNEAFIHSNPHFSGYHIDILADLETSDASQPGIFFVSMATPALQNILKNGQAEGHLLILLRNDTNGKIDLTAHGPGDQLEREKKLSDSEISTLLATNKVKNTRWLLVDLPSPGLLKNHEQMVWREASHMMAVLLVVVVIMLFFVSRGEKLRRRAEQALMDANANLERRVSKRTEELRQSMELLAHQASHDSLTNLLNRSTFEKQLETCLHERQTDSYTSILLYIDLDNFKVINETAGHAAGDECLSQLSQLLISLLPVDSLIGRMSGDEFATLIPNVDDKGGIAHADRIIEAIREYRFVWDEREFEIGSSIGAVPVGPTTIRQDLLLGSADVACMAAKEIGQNSVQLFKHSDEELKRRRSEMDWATRFRKALCENRFELHAQPIISTIDNPDDFHWYELLIRLRDETQNLIYPNDFIPAAERYGGMAKIDCWMVTKAIQTLSENIALPLYFSVNLSGQTLGDEESLRYLLNTITNSANVASRLCLEVTETAAIKSFSRTRPFFDKVHTLGVKVALDDFGAGLSSYGYLRQLNLDYIKIDGSLVRDIENDRYSKAIVGNINSLGQSLGKEVIAEYVENEGVFEVLKALGVAYGQGYHLGRPRPLDEVVSSHSTAIYSVGN